MNDDEFDKLQDAHDLCGTDGRLRDFADAIEATSREYCARVCEAVAKASRQHDDVHAALEKCSRLMRLKSVDNQQK